MSLSWRIAPERVGIDFDHLDQLSEIIDAVAREGRYRLFPGAEDGGAAIFRIHFDTDFLQQVLVLAVTLRSGPRIRCGVCVWREASETSFRQRSDFFGEPLGIDEAWIEVKAARTSDLSAPK
jgi:hypothetical protein